MLGRYMRTCLMIFLVLMVSCFLFAAVQGFLVVEAIDGVRVLVNDELKGLTVGGSSILMLNPGSYQITLEKDGYSSSKQTITIKESEATSLKVDMRKPEVRGESLGSEDKIVVLGQKAGTVEIRSVPFRGAEIKINGVNYGQTDRRLTNLPIGQIQVQVMYEGNTVSGTFMVKENQTVQLQANYVMHPAQIIQLYDATLIVPKLPEGFRAELIGSYGSGIIESGKSTRVMGSNHKVKYANGQEYIDFEQNIDLNESTYVRLDAPEAKLLTKWKDPTVFCISNGPEPESLDPALIQGVPEHRIFEALFEGLVANDPETALAVPGVAESWEANADGTRYTFKIRRNAMWSDGKPITAHDVVYSWLRILNPATRSPYAWFPCMFIEGAEAYNAGNAGAQAVGIRAIDDRTFQMDLIGPLPYAVDALSHYSFAIVPRHAIEKYGSAWTDPANFVGNGPFVLSERVAQTLITAVKNDLYWDKDNVMLDKVIFYSSENAATNYNMYLNGEIDWITEIPSDQFYRASMYDDFHISPQLATYYYVFQTEIAPLNNPLVRKALALAINREALIRDVLGSGQIPAWGIVPPMTGYEGLEFPYSNMGDAITEAQRLLAQAGYPNGAGFPTIPILYNTNEGNRQIAQLIQRQWRNNLGINVVLDNQEWQTYLSNRNRGNFHIARAGWVGDYQDPNTFLDMFITGSGMNGGKYSNEVYDLLINEAARMDAGTDRFGVLAVSEDIIINQDQAIMPLYYYGTVNMIDTDKWGGWYANTMDYHPLKTIYPK